MCPNRIKELITIIIPAYNCQAYIGRCLDGILIDDIPNIEILVVNDGSTDKTAKVLEQYGDRIRVINKPNGGVSSARNTGIMHAKGAYITFVDADDELPEGVLLRYIQCIEAEQNIVCMQGCFSEGEHTGNLSEIDSLTLRKLCLNYPRSLRESSSFLSGVKEGVHGCYGKLFKTDHLRGHKLLFSESLGLGEDLLFYYDYLRTVDKVHTIDMQTYRINVTEGSATRRLNKRMPEYAMKFADAIMERVNSGDVALFDVAAYQINMHVNVAVLCYFAHKDNRSLTVCEELKDFLSSPNINMAYKTLLRTEKNAVRKMKYFLLFMGWAKLYLKTVKLSNKV